MFNFLLKKSEKGNIENARTQSGVLNTSVAFFTMSGSGLTCRLAWIPKAAFMITSNANRLNREFTLTLVPETEG